MSSIIERARKIIRCEVDALLNIPFDSNFEKAVHIVYGCKGKVVTTGMGKAGTIAMKTAGTLCSTGTPSCFLHPGDAAHGDLGLLSKDDVILAFSTSGKTREVIETLQLARHLGIGAIIGITSHPDSVIRKLCDVVLNMGIIKEPCHLGLTPTASSVVMLAIADALSLIVMERRRFTRRQYGLRHHGGYLGEKARMPRL